MKFARPETDRAKAQRLSSFKYLEKKKAEEPWKKVQFCNPQVCAVLYSWKIINAPQKRAKLIDDITAKVWPQT